MRATGNATISELVEDPFQCPEIPAVSVQKEVVRSIHHQQGSLHPEQERGTDPPPRHKNPHPQVPHLNVELINHLWEFPATVPRREITISNTELGPGPDMNAGLESQTAPVPAEPFHNAPQRGDWTKKPNPQGRPEPVPHRLHRPPLVSSVTGNMNSAIVRRKLKETLPWWDGRRRGTETGDDRATPLPTELTLCTITKHPSAGHSSLGEALILCPHCHPLRKASDDRTLYPHCLLLLKASRGQMKLRPTMTNSPQPSALTPPARPNHQ